MIHLNSKNNTRVIIAAATIFTLAIMMATSNMVAPPAAATTTTTMPQPITVATDNQSVNVLIQLGANGDRAWTRYRFHA